MVGVVPQRLSELHTAIKATRKNIWDTVCITSAIVAAHRHLKALRTKAIDDHREAHGRGERAPRFLWSATTFATAAIRLLGSVEAIGPACEEEELRAYAEAAKSFAAFVKFLNGKTAADPPWTEATMTRLDRIFRKLEPAFLRANAHLADDEQDRGGPYKFEDPAYKDAFTKFQTRLHGSNCTYRQIIDFAESVQKRGTVSSDQDRDDDSPVEGGTEARQSERDSPKPKRTRVGPARETPTEHASSRTARRAPPRPAAEKAPRTRPVVVDSTARRARSRTPVKEAPRMRPAVVERANPRRKRASGKATPGSETDERRRPCSSFLFVAQLPDDQLRDFARECTMEQTRRGNQIDCGGRRSCVRTARRPPLEIGDVVSCDEVPSAVIMATTRHATMNIGPSGSRVGNRVFACYADGRDEKYVRTVTKLEHEFEPARQPFLWPPVSSVHAKLRLVGRDVEAILQPELGPCCNVVPDEPRVLRMSDALRRSLAPRFALRPGNANHGVTSLKNGVGVILHMNELCPEMGQLLRRDVEGIQFDDNESRLHTGPRRRTVGWCDDERSRARYKFAAGAGIFSARTRYYGSECTKTSMCSRDSAREIAFVIKEPDTSHAAGTVRRKPNEKSRPSCRLS